MFGGFGAGISAQPRQLLGPDRSALGATIEGRTTETAEWSIAVSEPALSAAGVAVRVLSALDARPDDLDAVQRQLSTDLGGVRIGGLTLRRERRFAASGSITVPVRLKAGTISLSGQAAFDSDRMLRLEITLSESGGLQADLRSCLLYTSPSPRDATLSRMPSSA